MPWPRGKPRTEETKLKIAEKLRGRKRPAHSQFMKENSPTKNPVIAKKVGDALRGRRRLELAGDKNPSRRPEVKAKIREKNLPLLRKFWKGKDNPFYGRKHTPETIEKLKNAPRVRGPNHPRWKGGSFRLFEYWRKGWMNTQNKVLERDKHTCKRCGSGEKLVVHHIVPYRESKTHDLSNLITLCMSCHNKAHWDLVKQSGVWGKDISRKQNGVMKSCLMG